jgi:hypothetical protein
MIQSKKTPIPVSQNVQLDDTAKLIHHICTALFEFSQRSRIVSDNVPNTLKASSVMFALGAFPTEAGGSSEICLILNKRSENVRQPGDLCCPGGSISSRLDLFLSNMLRFPGSPLTRWPHWPYWRDKKNPESKSLAILLAAALRESFEEMRMNPVGVSFLGPLPPQQLAMFKRIIYPMVCWVPHQKRFFPNREVEKLVYVPLRKLLNPDNYALCRMRSHLPRKAWNGSTEKDFPCFIHSDPDPLWGATFRIAMVFLDIVFGFRHPDPETLPMVHRALEKNYLTGNRS